MAGITLKKVRRNAVEITPDLIIADCYLGLLFPFYSLPSVCRTGSVG